MRCAPLLASEHAGCKNIFPRRAIYNFQARNWEIIRSVLVDHQRPCCFMGTWGNSGCVWAILQEPLGIPVWACRPSIRFHAPDPHTTWWWCTEQLALGIPEIGHIKAYAAHGDA